MKYLNGRLSLLLRLFAFLAVLVPLLITAVPSIADDSPDYAVADGWFYSQTGGGNGDGYSVLDADTDSAGQTMRFWTAFQRLGGVATLGYPASRVYVGADGFTYQAFQGGVLQWRPERGDAVLANTFDMLESAGKSGWLTDVKGLPQPIADDGSGGDFQKAVSTRLGWLTDPDIRDRVLANPNPQVIDTWNDTLALQLYGLPKSRPEQHGPFISQLFQRISVQKWTTSVPGMPPVGSVTVVLGGDLLKEAGLIPASATQVQGPGGVVLVTAPATPPPTPTPAAGTNAWELKQAAVYPNCGTTFFTVSALDANGNPVNGLTVRSWNDAGNQFDSVTQNHNGSDGYADRVLSSGVSAGKWYVQLVDGEGRPSSNVVTIFFSDTCDPGQGAVNQVSLQLRQLDSSPTTAATSYPWRIRQVAALPNCGTTYVRLVMLDGGGNGMNGMVFRSWNDFGNNYEAGTSYHDGINGYWDRVISTGPSAGTWYVMLVDGQGRQSSNIMTVSFTGNCAPNQGAAVQEVALEVRPN